MTRQSTRDNSTWARQPSTQDLRAAYNAPPTSSTNSRLLPFRRTPTLRAPDSAPTARTRPRRSSSSLREEAPVYIPPNTKATFQWMRGELLGQGSYGRVYMALNVNTGVLMAVKQVEIQGDHKPANQEALKFLAFENKTLRELDHPNVVQYLGYEASDEMLSVFLEYVPGGTIATLLHQYGRFREEVTKSFIRQILDGLEYLHSCGILHRDLKPDNILVEPTGVCKITDFGISKRVDDVNGARAHTLMRGTVQYMAPEILSKDKGYDGKIDIWSIGCMILEMWSGEKPWGPDENFLSIMVKLDQRQSPPPLPPQLVKELTPHAHHFRDQCFHINPVQRPSAGELKQHHYLRIPTGWTFNKNEVPHPSRERRVGVKDRRKRDHRQDDGATDKTGKFRTGAHEKTLRQEDVHNEDSSSTSETIRKISDTIRQPEPMVPPRGPSPPVIFIKPVPRPGASPAPSPSPVEYQEQETTSGSSVGSSRTSGKRRHRYRVVNQGGDLPGKYDYAPPSLPPSNPDQAYSTHLGASPKYNRDYIPPEPFPPSRSRSSSTPHFQVTHTPHEAQATSPSHYPSLSSSFSNSSSSSSLPQASSGSEDSSTWKRLPATAPVRRARASSSSSNSRYGSPSSSSHRQAVHLRTPPPPTMPPPLPPAEPPFNHQHLLSRTPPRPTMPPPLPPSPSPSSNYSDVTPPRGPREASRPRTPHRRGNRPNADDIVRHLGDYFPDHDLDRPVIVEPSSSAEDLTESFNNYSLNDHSFDEEPPPPAPSTSAPTGSRFTRMTSQSPSGLTSLLRPTNFVSTSYPRSGYTTPTNTGSRGSSFDRPRYEPSIAPTDTSGPETSNNGARLGYTKSVRRLAEEEVSKRQSNPGRARRQTLWDIKMEEVKGLPPIPGSSQQNHHSSGYAHDT